MTSTIDPARWEHIEFVFDPKARTAASGELLVGLGSPSDGEAAGVSLNSKFAGSPYRSVAGYVQAADDALVTQWRARFPHGPASVRRVVLHDLSLDSCYSFLRFLQRIGAEAPLAHESWTRYVTRWEEGYTREAGDWQDSLAFLVTVLGHSYLDLEDTGPSVVAPSRFADGARACLSLLAGALAQGRDPMVLDMRSLGQLPVCQHARAHLAHEEMQYRQAKERAICCQLRVPLAGSGRFLLVDAMFVEERNPSGVLKFLARSDSAGSWNGRGFDVLGIHRPLAAGTGGDMTISVAPESGLSLQELWNELEQRENVAWAGSRPCDNPRPIASYRDRAGAPNEPWWDDHGRYTLLGAPRAVQLPDGTMASGTRLDWREGVLSAIWACYSPIPTGMFAAEQSQLHGGKRLTIVTWAAREQSTTAQPMAAALGYASAQVPTFLAWLASRSRLAPEPVASPATLGPASSYQVFQLAQGCMVAHRDGVTLYAERGSSLPDQASIVSIFEGLAAACAVFVDFHQQRTLERALEYQQRLVAGGQSGGHRFDQKEFEIWKARGLAARASMLKASVGVINHADPWPLNEARALLQRMWGLEEQRIAAMNLADQIDKVTSEIAGHMREHRTRLVQGLVSGVGLGILLKEVVEVAEPLFVPNLHKWLLQLARPTLPPEALPALDKVVKQLHIWHEIAAGALLLGVVLGFVAYLRLGAKGGGH